MTRARRDGAALLGAGPSVPPEVDPQCPFPSRRPMTWRADPSGTIAAATDESEVLRDARPEPSTHLHTTPMVGS